MRLLAALLVLAAAAPAEDLSRHIPAGSPLAVRVASLDRIDALAKEWVPLLESFGAEDVALVLKEVALSAVLFEQSGLDRAAVDTGRPLHLAFSPRGLFLVGHPAPGASWQGERALKGGHAAVLRDGALLAGRRDLLKSGARGSATAFLPGDIAVHVYVDEIAAGNRDRIEQVFALAALQGTARLPEQLRPLALPFASAAKNALFGVASLDYALTWRKGKLASEGRLRTKERTPLREAFRRAGAPRDNPLVSYLPSDAFLAFDFATESDWPGDEFARLLDAALGEGAGGGLLQVFNLAAPVSRHLTGRMAGSVSIVGLGAGTVGVAELKEGVEAARLFQDYDVAAANRALTAVGAPVTLKLEKNVTRHGAVDLHRVTITSEAPELQLFVNMVQAYVAADRGHLLAVISPTARRDLGDLLDRVAQGRAAGHWHARAMARLGPKRSFGFTLNVAALRQLGMMLGAVEPGAADVATRIPDDFMLSTSFAFENGDLRWRGDWPLREMAALAEALREIGEEQD